jgi:hypothetical protein
LRHHLQELFDHLEDENMHSLALVILCIQKLRFDLVEKAAKAAVIWMECEEITSEAQKIQREVLEALHNDES